MEIASGLTQSEDVPIIEEHMMWSPFGEKFEARYGQPIMSFACFHTGTTTSVRKSTIRTTRGGNRALILGLDSGESFVAVSKAQGFKQGGDAMAMWDPHFIGWIRRYEASFVLDDRWSEIDADVDMSLLDEEDPDAMKLRANDEDQWTNFYLAQFDDKF